MTQGQTSKTYLSSVWPNADSLVSLFSSGRIAIASTLSGAVQHADIIQEQGPEDRAFKQDIWAQVEPLAKLDALFWSSTSGIPATVQAEKLHDKNRVIVVHPYNPPHIMPLLEIVPTPIVAEGGSDTLVRTLGYWETLGRSPVVIKKEVPGFVANRLAFVLFREAAYLADLGVASPADIDRIVEQSLGPRWAVRGPFWSYHAGGGPSQGLEYFFDKIGATIQECWDDVGVINLRKKGDVSTIQSWEDKLCRDVEEVYGTLGTQELATRDGKLTRVLEVNKSPSV
ncbi:hypothetical protein Sste5346_006192 [Sporothrix stenoceras]|uniref:3-hydroxyacyl-CoA dehydrogenase n=1 Tax=Sporothrix stenoceras TaxID=5173 RepID=A0ABR3Z173_9PEZI